MLVLSQRFASRQALVAPAQAGTRAQWKDEETKDDEVDESEMSEMR